MDPELLAAYERTEYRVLGPGPAFALRIGEPSAALRACHENARVTCSTFITAWNPHSRQTPREENESAMVRLQREVTSMNLSWLEGEGIDPGGTWPGEPSLLVPGLDEATAVALARRYRQNAIVCAGPDAAPRLVTITPST